MQKEVYLVVVSILEGRNFPKRNGHQLVVECKFDGELLSTDPIDHSESPDFTTELAWEIDKKALHQHRMQRTPIKLQCCAVNASSGVREQIGYVLLDLRLAQQKSQSPKWYNLLSSKYSRLKPAIKVGMALEDDLPVQDNAFRARDAPPRAGKLSERLAGNDLVAKLDENEGHFQIGSPENCYDMFVLSVTVGFAANLEQLVPSDKRLPSPNTGYFFYYSLLGNDVTDDPFPDLLNPEFVPERASVRIRSSVDALRAYLAGQSSLQIHLCSGDHSLGSAEIPLNTLLKKGSKEIDIKPIVKEGAFTLYPPNIIKQQLQSSMEAKVGVSICLRREEILSDHAQTEDELKDRLSKQDTHQTEAAPQDVPERDVAYECHIEQSPPSPETQIQRTSTPPKVVKPTVVATDDEADSIHLDSETCPKQTRDARSAGSKNARKEVSTEEPATLSDATNFTITSTHPVVPPEARHYRFSLHLKSIANLDLPFICKAYLKYSYPFFGSAAPVLTNPPVEVSKRIETKLAQSLCTFDFACTPPLLHNTFSSVPLVVELWHSDKESNDILIATAVIPLPTLIMQEPIQFVITSEGARRNTEGTRLSYFTKLEMRSVQDLPKRVADLNVSLILEDLGRAREQKMLQPVQQTKQVAPKQKNPPTTSEPPRQTAEYEAALELELWKEQQEQHFENQLKEKEIAHMRSLAEEWQRRDRERECLVNKRILEYNKLEAKLRKSVAEIDAREKQLANNELELARIRTDIQREHERVLAQAKEATDRMKQDCVHQVQLERNRVRILEDEKTKLKSQLMDAERKYTGVEQKFQNFKLEQNNMPEVRLQSELQLITLEKNELERKLESVNKSKLHYKQQWGRALKELARLKQREQEHALANLKRQQDELEQMRMRYFANEERETNVQGQKQLLEIKEELQRLKVKDSLSVTREAPSIMIGASTQAQGLFQPELAKASDHVDEHVARLIEERDTLLRTGVYDRQDRIIVELDRQIRDAISRKTAS